MAHRGIAIAAAALALVAAGCFSPDEPVCSFQCGSYNGYHCPPDYSCNRGDTTGCAGGTVCYCIRSNYTGACPFPQPDLAEVSDLATPDLAVGDLTTAGGADGASGPDGGAPADSAAPVDAVTPSDSGKAPDGGGTDAGVRDLASVG